MRIESPAPEDEPSRLPYRRPRLEEWGTVLDLTRGPKAGNEDFPAVGGTRGV